jgi:hypothetical protein
MLLSSRYLPLVMPVVLAVFLHCTTISRPAVRRVSIGILAVTVIWASAFMREADVSDMVHTADGKRNWVYWYLQTRSAKEAQELSDFQLFPTSRFGQARIDQRLPEMQKRQLGLYRSHKSSARGPAVTLVGGLLSVCGTDGADSIRISCSNKTITVERNGETIQFPQAAVGRIAVAGRGGDDVITMAANITVPAVIWGDGGNDRITGATKDDKLYGGDGDDLLVGGPGNDSLYGAGGNDFLQGGPGDDLLVGGKGNDRYRYGEAVAGEDEVVENPGEGEDVLDFTGINGQVTADLTRTKGMVTAPVIVNGRQEKGTGPAEVEKVITGKAK